MYLAALPGGWLADNWLGQQKAVWYGSILIALGHLSIALSAIMGNDLFFVGLMFIVLGSGLFQNLYLGNGWNPVQERRCAP
ncbi:Di-/tripeptide transporter [Serratia fonticola]|uniref:Di-/tripeptide transporter n=1 Tax=Serratia fonticola TaxID=47917 RepID=A0A4U9VPH7_SERFO|nr:Di-/tripeptide transporter [Serratia fonticola]